MDDNGSNALLLAIVILFLAIAFTSGGASYSIKVMAKMFAHNRAGPPVAELPATLKRRHVLLALGWYAEGLHAGVARYAKKAHWVLDASLLHAFEPSQEWYGDGIIWVAGVNPRLDRFIRAWRKPVVNIGYTPTPGIPRVASDPNAVMQMALEHFQSHGFRQFAFYLHTHRPGPMVKLEAFRRAVDAADGTFHVIDLPAAQKKGEPNARRSPYRWLANHIKSLPSPLAVVAETDDPAIQVVHACVEAGIVIPDRVAVLGINDDLLRCPLASIPLSSIDDNMETIGYRAAEILHNILSGNRKQPPLTLIPPRGLTARQSTDILAVESEPVAVALQLIRTRFRENITAEAIASHVSVSQRQLHTDFTKIVGRSLADELAFHRFTYARNLLLQTDLKLPVIARQSGFGNANRLCRTFKKITGLTPGKLKRKLGSD